MPLAADTPANPGQDTGHDHLRPIRAQGDVCRHRAPPNRQTTNHTHRPTPARMISGLPSPATTRTPPAAAIHHGRRRLTGTPTWACGRCLSVSGRYQPYPPGDDPPTGHGSRSPPRHCRCAPPPGSQPTPQGARRITRQGTLTGGTGPRSRRVIPVGPEQRPCRHRINGVCGAESVRGAPAPLTICHDRTSIRSPHRVLQHPWGISKKGMWGCGAVLPSKAAPPRINYQPACAGRREPCAPAPPGRAAGSHPFPAAPPCSHRPGW